MHAVVSLFGRSCISMGLGPDFLALKEYHILPPPPPHTHTHNELTRHFHILRIIGLCMYRQKHLLVHRGWGHYRIKLFF